MPDFSVPRGRWKSLSEKVAVITPDGRQHEAVAQFTVDHFNIPDPDVSVDKPWRLVICLPEAKKEDIPIGSRLPVSPGLRDAVLAGNAA